MRIKGAFFGFLFLLASQAPAWEALRLPWIFSDEPDLCADFGFSPGKDGKTHVELTIGGRFGGFKLPRGAARAPQLSIVCEFSPPGSIDKDPVLVTATLDLGKVLEEYGEKFDRKHFKSSSTFVYKAELPIDLVPGDYNVSIALEDPALEIRSQRTLHMFVPALRSQAWSLGDLKFISAVGKRLDEKGKEQRLLDPNPWRQVGGKQALDLMVAYDDLGSRPGGKLMRRHSIHRLRGDEVPVFKEEGEAPAKKASQIWILKVPGEKAQAWQAGTYVLQVELWVGKEKVEGSKTFQVLP